MLSIVSNTRWPQRSVLAGLTGLALAAQLPGNSSANGVAPAMRVVDCNSFAHYPNTKVTSARNMTCRQAVRELRRHKGPISRSFRTPGGFRCTRVSGGELGGQWRCVKGPRAFRFEFGD